MTQNRQRQGQQSTTPATESSETTEATGSTDATTGADSTTSEATDSVTTGTAVVKPKKAKTRAQLAREEAGRLRAAQDEEQLAGSPTFQVTYPAGISVYSPGKDEVEVTMSGGEKVWIDVEGEHAHIPNEARVRASTVTELNDFTRLAASGLLKQVLATH